MAKITNAVLFNEIQHVKEQLNKLNGQVSKNTAWRNFTKGALAVIGFILTLFGIKIFGG